MSIWYYGTVSALFWVILLRFPWRWQFLSEVGRHKSNRLVCEVSTTMMQYQKRCEDVWLKE